MKFRLFFTPIVILSMVLFAGCKKFLTIPPPQNQIASSQIFESDATAIGAITGIYSEMMVNSNPFTSGTLTQFTSLSADELTFYSTTFRDEFFNNSLTQGSHGVIDVQVWSPAYRYIYAANAVLENIDKSSRLSNSVRVQLKGEAKFIRAFCYFHLVNLFGGVPMVTTTNYQINSTLPRTSADSIYELVQKDLIEAKSMLPAAYPTGEKIRPNKWAATALLARVYLYRAQWAKAESEATDLIANGGYSLVPSLSGVFLKNSAEAIWQLAPVNPTVNTWEGNIFLPPSATSQPNYIIRPELVNSFEVGDQRKTVWIGSRTVNGQVYFHPAKYKVYGNSAPITEYYMVLRLAEVLLIRSEARLMQNNLTGAAQDLQTIRQRAGLSNALPNDSVQLTAILERERQHELMFEWGHRWYDLKRMARADAILGALKGAAWQPTDVLWPVPQTQINANPYLTQNPGY